MRKWRFGVNGDTHRLNVLALGGPTASSAGSGHDDTGTGRDGEFPGATENGAALGMRRLECLGGVEARTREAPEIGGAPWRRARTHPRDSFPVRPHVVF